MIFDDELSPAQGRNIENALKTRVMDRAEIILDIFATRARSNEARLQVELAQLQYMFPRLTRMWTHLEKTRGGIGVGMRGPGETQLETDRRLVQNRIKLLRERLLEVDKVRAQQRQNRTQHFRVALVGYTNAGKSSILRAMTSDQSVFVEDRLFATLDPLTREIDLGDGNVALLTDTVGFIRKLPHHLVASFRATLAEARESDLLLHVIDASQPVWEEHRAVVDGVLHDLDLYSHPTIHVFNKTDALPPDQLAALRARVAELIPGSVFASALTAGGVDDLTAAIRDAVQKERPVYSITVPASDGRLLADVHRQGEVLKTEHRDGETVFYVRLDEASSGRLRRAGVHLIPVGSRFGASASASAGTSTEASTEASTGATDSAAAETTA